MVGGLEIMLLSVTDTWALFATRGSRAGRAVPMELPMVILRNVRVAGNLAQLERG